MQTDRCTLIKEASFVIDAKHTENPKIFKTWRTINNGLPSCNCYFNNTMGSMPIVHDRAGVRKSKIKAPEYLL